ncbi:MAG: acyl-CoA dehydratase activase-related protein, partial [Myxococcota bacterium]
MKPPPEHAGEASELVLGFDIGSTGSKLVAVDASKRAPVWSSYLRTGGDPVGAARSLLQRFVEGPAGDLPVTDVGVTGSGREIVGSLLSTCFGKEPVFVLNEIAAHAEGALHFDPRVDTIFEIGGQDAKYVRLAGGKVVDAAMNEACSAGTGSFIEEQGRRFEGIDSVEELGRVALSAPWGISLGQHCSVFMAEIIDEAIAAGEPHDCIIAGIYDSIIQNYLNRVKGSRSVGSVIFCQGMPFASDALAAAVVRQTGGEVIIPPDPGTTGALGIALLTLEYRDRGQVDAGEEASLLEPKARPCPDGPATPFPLRPALQLSLFLSAKLEARDTFVCKSNKGCGGAGNKCRIERLKARVEGTTRRFTWGGGCSMWEKGTKRTKLPDRSPDPFRERAELVSQIITRVSSRRGGPLVGISDEFQLKGLFPFFATFLHECGFDLQVCGGADSAILKRGIETANVPFCAPMQMMHGVAATLASGEAAKDEHGRRPDLLFLPMLISLPKVGDERAAATCPIVQGSPDLTKLDLGPGAPRVLSPVIRFGDGGLETDSFQASCEALARSLDVPMAIRRRAFQLARRCQERFDAACLDAGRRALRYCRQHGVVPVVVIGRTYTIHNTVLNSNVPAILREQGAIAIPVDCYPLAKDVPVFQHMFWGYGQRNLRAAHQVRRSKGTYAVYCSNYSCGPDSFTLHLFAWAMEGRPFAIVETDGHSGDAGTRTRIEAFLHCVREDLSREEGPASRDLRELDTGKQSLLEVKRRNELLLVPRMGPGSEAAAACMRAAGLRAEALP